MTTVVRPIAHLATRREVDRLLVARRDRRCGRDLDVARAEEFSERLEDGPDATRAEHGK